jgi:hypothetical protein
MNSQAIKILNNKWPFGKTRFTDIKIPDLHKNFNGIFTLNVSLDNSLGSEVALYIRDETDFIYDVAKVSPFQLFMKSGVVRTDHGPLMFMLFHIPDPRYKNRPFAMYDIHLNPLKKEFLMPFYDLSRQSHWHLFLLNKNNEQVGFFEFENTYELFEALQTVEEACKGIESIDFWKAKEEFMNQYSLEDLYEM